MCVRLAHGGLQPASSRWPGFEWPAAKNGLCILKGAVKSEEDD